METDEVKKEEDGDKKKEDKKRRKREKEGRKKLDTTRQDKLIKDGQCRGCVGRPVERR